MRAGSSQRSSGGSLIGVDEIILHPDYNQWTWDSDIAVLHSTTAFAGTNIATIPLVASGTAILAGWMATVSGWGSTVTTFSNTLESILVICLDF
jgi:trypsin